MTDYPKQQEQTPKNKEVEGFAAGFSQKEWLDFRRQVTELANVLEKMRLADYIAYLNNPRRMLLINFGVSLVRGLGVALGASILAGLALLLLKQLVVLNLPVIGGLIAELVRIVNLNTGK